MSDDTPIYAKTTPSCATTSRRGRRPKSKVPVRRQRGRDRMKHPEGKSRNLQSLYEGWVEACMGIAGGGDRKELARRAGIVDVLFPIDQIVERWLDILREEPEFGRSLVPDLRQPDDQMDEVLAAVREQGFEYAASKTEGAGDGLPRILFDPERLELLQSDISPAEEMSHHWAERFMAAGRSPDIRVFDLEKEREVPLSFASGDCPRVSPAETRFVEQGRVKVEIYGWNGYRGRRAACALLPRAIAGDEIFTREPKVPFPPSAGETRKRPRASTKAWEALRASPEVPDSSICDAAVSESGVLTCEFTGVIDASELAKKLLVVVLLR